MRRAGRVQPANRCFRVAEVSGEIGRQGELPPGERVGEIGVVLATLAVVSTHPLERRVQRLLISVATTVTSHLSK